MKKSPLSNTLFAASIHEIKNRFALMMNQLDEVLSDVNVDEEKQAQVAGLRSDAQFIGSELVRVLSVFKASGENFHPAIDQQFLEDFLEEIVARHHVTAQASGCNIHFECDEDLTAFFDSGIVSVVMDTCIYNAVKAGATHIALRADSDAEFLHIYVDDNGPGFPPEMLGDSIDQGSINVAEKSTGLGLFFANSLLASHIEGKREGHITLAISPENGARVMLSIPV